MRSLITNNTFTEMITKRTHRVYRSLTRAIPTVIAAMSLIHVTAYAFGVCLRPVDFIYATSVSSCVFMLVISEAFRMCRLHKLMIVYSLFVSLLIRANALFEVSGALLSWPRSSPSRRASCCLSSPPLNV